MIKNNDNKNTAVTNVAYGKESSLLFFSGSNSSNSINQRVVEALARESGKKNQSIIDLRNYPMPLYSDAEENKGIPKKAVELLEIIEKHDTLVIAVPEYNSAMPAFFKNILDWISRARQNYRVLKGKQVILLSASPGNGGYSAVLNTQIVLIAIGADILGSAVLTDFYNRTTLDNDNLIIKDTAFISQFNNMLMQLKKLKV